jgi:hypothetical protein
VWVRYVTRCVERIQGPTPGLREQGLRDRSRRCVSATVLDAVAHPARWLAVLADVALAIDLDRCERVWHDVASRLWEGHVGPHVPVRVQAGYVHGLGRGIDDLAADTLVDGDPQTPQAPPEDVSAATRPLPHPCAMSRLAADPIPVCVEPIVVVPHHNDAPGVQRPVAAAAQAVVIEGIWVQTRALIVGVARRGR